MPRDLLRAIASDGLALFRAVDLKERDRRHIARKRLQHRQGARDGSRVTGKEVPRRFADECDLAPWPDDFDRFARSRCLRPAHTGSIAMQHEVEVEAPLVRVEVADGVAPAYRRSIAPPEGQGHILAGEVVEAVQ